MDELKAYVKSENEHENESVLITANVPPTGYEEIPMGKVSDGYHTFDELYYHRMMLFAIVCNTYPENAWKSKLHDNGTMYDNYFIVGITTPAGDYSYHYHTDHWGMFHVKELDRAPVWDGHQPSDIGRLITLINNKK